MAIRLSENEKREVVTYLEQGKPLPEKYRFLLFKDDREVELVWNGKTSEITNVVLPFQVIEQIDEPRNDDKFGNPQIGMFDSSGKQITGWTNKLIWGDNKLILSSLKNGPMRKEIEAQGGLKLIYIDPPFDVGADFSMDIEIGEEEESENFTKKPSVIEEIAYRDTWGKGADSFIAMIYERLKLMHELLAEDGSIYVHCDWRVNSYMRLILDEIFGKENFRNEIIWQYSGGSAPAGAFTRKHDTILRFIKNKQNFIFNETYEDYAESTVNRYNLTDQDGKKYKITYFKGKEYKAYMKEGKKIEDVWFISKSSDQTRKIELIYPTQKPEALIERIIEASTNPGDLVADFFCGSGTTLSVAEKLGRKWIGTDLGKFGIHTTRKRMIGVQRELKKRR
jgi:adenine specific DNA methylase Mod